jgi:DNA (cytosine-5)-methyltransferase 1
VIELFAGAGGLALGLERAGFSTRALVERDKYCCETLLSNRRYFPDASVIQRDIRWLSVPQLLRTVGLRASDIDLVSGGPPCQSFSISKISKGGRSPQDPRDDLLWHFVRFVKKIKPTVFLFENVPGLLNKSGGRIFFDFLKALKRLGYATNHDVLNAASYGAPQIRKRLFIVGRLGTQTIEFPTVTHGPPGNPLRLPQYATISQALSGLSAKMPNQRRPKNRPEKVKMLGGIPQGSGWKHFRYRDRWDGPSRCITAHCRDDWVHPIEPRAGTVRELARLQTFPNHYVFRGPFNAPNNSKFAFQYRQVGNSVTVLLAKTIGKQIVSIIPTKVSNSAATERHYRPATPQMVRQKQTNFPLAGIIRQT